MQKFYIHKDNQQQGPFSIEELKNLKISRETMIWFEGADNWRKANEIEELNDIFKSIPPPISSITPPPFIEEKTGIDNKSTIKKKNPTLIYIIVAVVISIIGIYIYAIQQDDIQRQLEFQNTKIEQQEEIEALRLAEEERQRKEAEALQRQAELESLKYQHDEAVTNLRASKIKLEEIQKFQFLRTPEEKEEQIQIQLEVIRSWENEVERLKKEIEKY